MLFLKFVFLFYLVHEICAKTYDIEFKKFEVMPETDPEFLDFGTIRIVKKSRTEVKLSGKFSLFQKLTNVGQLSVVAVRLNSMGLPGIRVFYLNAGFCDLLSSGENYYDLLVNSSDMPKEYCPMKPGNYTIYDFVVHFDDLPDVIPLGDYMCTIRYSLNSQIKFAYKATMTLVAAAKN